MLNQAFFFFIKAQQYVGFLLKLNFFINDFLSLVFQLSFFLLANLCLSLQP